MFTKVISLLAKNLWILAQLLISGRVHQLDEKIRQIIHVDLVPLGQPGADDGGEAVLQRPLGHVVGLDGPRVARAATGTVDARGADDGGLDGGGARVGGQDDLVHVAVGGFVRQGGDLGEVGYVVVLFIWVRGLAIALFVDIALFFCVSEKRNLLVLSSRFVGSSE